MAIHRRTDADGVSVTFVLDSEVTITPVSVVGSFNDWTPGAHPFDADPDGPRSVTIVVPAQVDVYFRYLGPDGWWFDDPEADEINADGSVLWAATVIETVAESPDAAESSESASETADVEDAADVEDVADVEVVESGSESAPEEDQEESPADEPVAQQNEEPVAQQDDEPVAKEDGSGSAPDESGDRLETVTDLIDDAKQAARELVDRDVLDSEAVDPPSRPAEAAEDEKPEATTTSSS